MEIEIKKRSLVCEVIITSGNAQIIEDVLVNNRIDYGLIDQLVTVAIELSRINNVHDVNFVKNIFESFLNDSEQSELLEVLTTKNS